MSSKARQKELLKAWKNNEKEKARSSFPLLDETLAQFFQTLDSRLEASGCHHDTRLAQAVIDDLKITDQDANALLDWCADNGGYCDCEIAANSQQHWFENRAAT